MSEQIGNESENWKMSDRPEDQLGRPEVFVSHASMGDSRDSPDGVRVAAAGNMSENWGQPTEPNLDKADYSPRALENVQRFLEGLGVEPGKTAILRPQTNFSGPLQTNDVDVALPDDPARKTATWLEQRGDLIYTRDPEKVLACRPADCPVMVVRGHDIAGQDTLILAHLGWQSLDAGYAEQSLAFMRDQLGLDFASAKIHIAPGARVVTGHPDRSLHYYRSPSNPLSDENPRFSHPERDKLYVNVVPTTHDGQTVFDFDIDAFGFLRHQLREAGIRDEQVFEDVSNTIAPESGYSSHSRASNHRDTEINTRDMIVATMRSDAGVWQAKL